MKLELLVIADQNAAVNAFPGLVHTARHTMGVGGARSRLANLLEAVVEGETNNWGEVVRRCGWITSFLRRIAYCLILRVH